MTSTRASQIAANLAAGKNPTEGLSEEGAPAGAGNKDEQQQQPANNGFDWKKESDGLVSGPDEFKAVVSKYKKLQDIDSALPDFENTFANPEIRAYNEFVKASKISDQTIFNVLKGIEGEIDPIDAIAISQVLAAPRLAAKYDTLKTSLQKKYGINSEQWLSEDSQYAPEKSDIDLELDGGPAIEKVKPLLTRVHSALKGGTNPISEVIESRKAKVADVSAKWQKFGEILQSQDLAPLQFGSATGGDPANPQHFLINPPKEVIGKLMAEEFGKFANKGVELNEQTSAEAIASSYQRYIAENLETILQEHADYLKKSTMRGLELQYNNPTKINKPASGGAAAKSTAFDKAMEQTARRIQQAD
jgi:hypothetical protein